MRIRTIKPEFFDSPHTASVSAVVRLAYIGLWCCADDAGRGRLNVKELEGSIFPFDDISELSGGEFETFGGLLPPLAAAFGVRFYRVDGRDFYDIPSWERHQRVRSGRESKLPAYEDGEPLELQPKVGQPDNWPPLAATGRHLPPGTGEQGNRGTGEINTPKPPRNASRTAEAARSARCENDSQFNQFWDIYPRRVGKQAAHKAWTKATTTTPAETILAGATRYASGPLPADARYIPHPATWLNQGRWDDDEPTQPATQAETYRQALKLIEQETQPCPPPPESQQHVPF